MQDQLATANQQNSQNESEPLVGAVQETLGLPSATWDNQESANKMGEGGMPVGFDPREINDGLRYLIEASLQRLESRDAEATPKVEDLLVLNQQEGVNQLVDESVVMETMIQEMVGDTKEIENMDVNRSADVDVEMVRGEGKEVMRE
jgi:hypothetical protein